MQGVGDLGPVDAAAFDVACLATAAGTPLSEATLRTAVQTLVREKDDGTTAADVMGQLAVAAVALYAPAAAITPRRAIFGMLSEHLPRELGDMPARLDGASRTQLGDVIALLEQSFGGRADAVGGPDITGDLLRRCDALERENAQLRSQVDSVVAELGVADLLKSNAELSAALYQAVAVADAAKMAAGRNAASVLFRGADADALATRDAATTCELVGGKAAAPSPRSPSPSEDGHDRKLAARMREVERRLESSAAAAEERALVAERKIVSLQSQLIEARRAAALGLPSGGTLQSPVTSTSQSRTPTPQPASPASPAVPASAAPAKDASGVDVSSQAGDGCIRHWWAPDSTRSTSGASSTVATWADEREAWATERARLIAKLRTATELLASSASLVGASDAPRTNRSYGSGVAASTPRRSAPSTARSPGVAPTAALLASPHWRR